MKPSNKILEDELQEIAPTLAKLDKVNFYELREGYFTDFGLDIIESISQPQVVGDFLSKTLSVVDKAELYTQPAASYFEFFADDIINKVHTEEVKEELSYILPVLQHSEKRNFYEVSSAYFESFPELVTAIVSKETSRRSNPVSQWGSKWSQLLGGLSGLVSRPQYALAMASIVSIIVCSVLVFNKQSMSEEDRIFAQMQQIPDADIHSYISGHRDEFDERTLLLNINNVDFTHYFDKPEEVTPHIESHVKGEAADGEITKDDILD